MATTDWVRAGTVTNDGGGTVAWTGETSFEHGASGSATYTAAFGFTHSHHRRQRLRQDP